MDDANITLANCMIGMLKDLCFTLTKEMKILDFGCGNGDLVKAFMELGYDAYGVDIIDCPGLDEEHYHKLGFDPYRLPYEDSFFDLVYSSSVFEHAQNTEECFREIHRVLKTGGLSIHSLPSRYRIIEPHIRVPFGGVIQAKWWLKLWALLGVRNEYQKGLPWKEVCERNAGYCKNGLNYHSFGEFKKIIGSVFGNVKAVKKEYINNMPGGAAKFGRKLPLPGYGSLIFFFREWEVCMKKTD